MANGTEDINSNVEEEIVENQISTDDDHVTHQPYQMDDLLYLKTIVVNEKNMPEVQDILQKTFKRRRELLYTDKINMLENFPCMFVNPKLVSKIAFNFIFLIIIRFEIVDNAFLLSSFTKLHFKIIWAFDSFHFFFVSNRFCLIFLYYIHK